MKKTSPTIESSTPSNVSGLEVGKTTSKRTTAAKWKEIFVSTHDLQDNMQKKMYIDQTGRFLQNSSRGNQYIMVLIKMDSDAILVEATNNRTSEEMVQAYQKLVDRLKA